jgi:hypothetical protein
VAAGRDGPPATRCYWRTVRENADRHPTPQRVPLFAILANLIPVVAVILLWAHFPKVGAWLLLFLAVPLAIGGYSHFLSPGSDNIFRMAPGALTLAFRVSAVLLLVLEILSCWVAVQILRDEFHGYEIEVKAC